MKIYLKQIIKKAIFYDKWRPAAKSAPRYFELDKNSNIVKRNYKDYEDYLNHQSEKLHVKLEEITDYDLTYEQVTFERYSSMFSYKGKSILCLAARLGGEVRAFKRMGALAIGIDIEPGEKNPHVLHGDFHALNFPDEVFDFAFCNAVDHVLDLDVFFNEVYRVLKENGVLIMELGKEKPSKYEVMDTQNHDPILEKANPFFGIEKRASMKNEIGFVNWNGFIYLLKKKFE